MKQNRFIQNKYLLFPFFFIQKLFIPIILLVINLIIFIKIKQSISMESFQPFKKKSPLQDYKSYEKTSEILDFKNKGQEQKTDKQLDSNYYYETFMSTLEDLKKDTKGSKEYDEQQSLINQFFFGFYSAYILQQILQKNQLREKCLQAKQSEDIESDQDLLTQLKIVDSALFHSTKDHHRLRITQLMAIYIYLKHPNKRVLLEILTGEGKSTIISCLAAILHIRGYNVDIVTTNQMLAKRDLEQKKQFYSLLGISVDHNFSSQNNDQLLGPKKCYTNKKIVYGIPKTYHVDTLYDEYKNKGTRNKRPFDVIIIDEVDLMFIDHTASQTLLSSTYAGFSELTTPMKIIWQQIIKNTIIKQNDGKVYMYMNGENQGQIVKGEINQTMRCLVNTIRLQFKNEVIQNQKQYFVYLSLQNWIHSAINAAYFFFQDVDYVIKDKKIVPIDKSTGSLLKDVCWNNGLHQFLQIKHGLSVTPESITSNFISNMGYFNRYQMIFGLTGTLGSKSSRQFLKETYRVQMKQIPSFFQRKLLTKPNYFMYNNKSWMAKIIQRCKQILKNKRSVLIICESIQMVKITNQEINEFISCQQPKIYTTGEENHSDEVNCGEIIIATNIAGRGMDLKPTKELIKSGGLHVMITYMPENLRVQMQARGRAGRNGAPGSSELIINHQSYYTQNNINLLDRQTFSSENQQDIIQKYCYPIRNKNQERKNRRDMQSVKKILLKDEKFRQFCKAVKKIPDYQKNPAKNKAIQEQWSMILKTYQNNEMDDEQFNINADNFIKRVQQQSQSFYNINHNFYRGLNKLYEDQEQAQKLFKQLQNENNSTMQQFSGYIGEVCLKGSLVNAQLLTKKTKEIIVELLEKSKVKIQQRKQKAKAELLVSNSTNNQQIVDIIEKQNERRKKRLKQSLEMSRIRQSAIYQSKIKMSNQQNQQNNLHNQFQALIKHPQIDMLDNIRQHIQNQIDSFKQLKQGQMFQYKLERCGKIFDRQNIDQNDQQQAALKKIQSQILCLPTFYMKKKKCQTWKRALVFCGGVAQIFVGALLIAQSGATLTAFGTKMIYQGLKDSWRAVFSQQQCADLQKFYTEKTFAYAMQLSTIGTKGLQMMKKLGNQSFKLIKNSSMSQIVNQAAKGIMNGLINSELNWSSMAKNYLFPGIKHMLSSDNIKKEKKLQQLTKKLMTQDVKQLIHQGSLQQKYLQKKSKKTVTQFEKNLMLEITTMLTNYYGKHLRNQIQPFIFKSQIAIHFISQVLDSNQFKILTLQTNKQLFNSIQTFLKLNQTVDKFIQKFGIQRQILSIFEQIKIFSKSQIQTEKYQMKIKQKEQLIKKVLKNYLHQYKKGLQQQYNQLIVLNQKINNEKLTASQKKTKINQQIVPKIKEFKTKFQKLDQYQKAEFKKYLNSENFLKQLSHDLRMNSVIKQSQNNANPAFIYIINRYDRQYRQKNNIQKVFIQKIQINIYNLFVSKVVKIIPKTFDGFSDRLDVMNKVQDFVINALKDYDKKDKE